MSNKMEGYAAGGTFLNARKLIDKGLKNKQITIKSVTWETIKDTPPEKPILEFENMEERLVLNKTNASTLMEAYSTDESQWIGKTLVLMITKKQYQGQMVDSITVAV